MTDDDEFRAYIAKLDAKAPGGSLLKGIPREDKQHEEAELARIVMRHLGKSGDFVAEPNGRDTPPDIAVRFSDGSSIGVEVTEFVDRPTRAWSMKKRETQRKAGLNQSAAFDAEQSAFTSARKAADIARQGGAAKRDVAEIFHAEYVIKHPSPDHIGQPYRTWDTPEFVSEIDQILAKKNQKLAGKTADFNEIYVAIFNSEFSISEEFVGDGKFLTKDYNNIDRIFFVLDYVPGRDFAVIELSVRPATAA